ncbi:hypothetical protein ACWD0G_12880, partial [Streptomyces goshikiensis]
ETLLRAPDAAPHLPVLHALAEHVARTAHTAHTAHTGPDTFGGWFWNRLRLPEPDRLDLLRRLLPADHRYLDAAARRLVRAPRFVQPLLCAWFTDERRLRGRPGATVATAAQALLHTHRRLAVDDLTEVLVAAAHPRADELLAVLAEEEPSALCRAVDRWARDERPGRRVAAAAYGPAAAPHVHTPGDRGLLRHAAQTLLARTAAPSGCCSATPGSAPGTCPTPSSASATPSAAPGRPPPPWSRPCPYCPIPTRCSTPCGPGPTGRCSAPWPRSAPRPGPPRG